MDPGMHNIIVLIYAFLMDPFKRGFVLERQNVMSSPNSVINISHYSQ